ncbi:hypothetical protein ZWY2020_036224 [Hordeum vulgare]|nr:hypothetical protein ZWY2020_036224 [Hordeum vulgare]
MNGYEATRRIREEENSYGIRTPIIALTANSVEKGLFVTSPRPLSFLGLHEPCQAAGDHVRPQPAPLELPLSAAASGSKPKATSHSRTGPPKKIEAEAKKQMKTSKGDSKMMAPAAPKDDEEHPSAAKGGSFCGPCH